MDDLISRQEVIDAIEKLARKEFDREKVYNSYIAALMDIQMRIEKLPTVYRGIAICQVHDLVKKPKKGEWINNIHDLPICNQCGYIPKFDRAIDDYYYSNFCPYCGADMRGDEDG